MWVSPLQMTRPRPSLQMFQQPLEPDSPAPRRHVNTARRGNPVGPPGLVAASDQSKDIPEHPSHHSHLVFSKHTLASRGPCRATCVRPLAKRQTVSESEACPAGTQHWTTPKEAIATVIASPASLRGSGTAVPDGYPTRRRVFTGAGSGVVAGPAPEAAAVQQATGTGQSLAGWVLPEPSRGFKREFGRSARTPGRQRRRPSGLRLSHVK